MMPGRDGRRRAVLTRVDLALDREVVEPPHDCAVRIEEFSLKGPRSNAQDDVAPVDGTRRGVEVARLQRSWETASLAACAIENDLVGVQREKHGLLRRKPVERNEIDHHEFAELATDCAVSSAQFDHPFGSRGEHFGLLVVIEVAREHLPDCVEARACPHDASL